MKTLLHTQKLTNGITVEFFDRSNRYFGDYHRICIDVACSLPLCPEFFAAANDPEAEWQRARVVLGEEVVFKKTLEKMGVPGAEVDDTRQRLMEEFSRTTFPYLQSPEFPTRFVAAELAKTRKVRHLFVPGR